MKHPGRRGEARDQCRKQQQEQRLHRPGLHAPHGGLKESRTRGQDSRCHHHYFCHISSKVSIFVFVTFFCCSSERSVLSSHRTNEHTEPTRRGPTTTRERCLSETLRTSWLSTGPPLDLAETCRTTLDEQHNQMSSLVRSLTVTVCLLPFFFTLPSCTVCGLTSLLLPSVRLLPHLLLGSTHRFGDAFGRFILVPV